ncbi:hypothetical protein AYX14_06054, partial [Cryptococcus neoformans]
MPPRQFVSNYSPLRARNENTPPLPAGVATGNVRAYPSSPSAKQFTPPLPADLQVPVMKIVPSVENIEGANRLLGHLKEALQNLQPTSLAGRHNTPFQSSDFSTVSALLPALGQRIPQLLPNVQQLDNKLEWVRSVLTSAIVTMECYINLFREKDKKISDLEDRASRTEERLRRLEAEETEQPIRKKARKLRQNRDINVESLVHGHVREMVGLPTNGPRRGYAPDKWPSYDPDMMPNGYHQDPGTNVTTWCPDWNNLRCTINQNFVEEAAKRCLQDKHCPADVDQQALQKRIWDYLESINSGKKLTIGRKADKNLRNTIRGRTRTFQSWVNEKFEKTPLWQCKERLLLKKAFSPKGILRSLNFVAKGETAYHGLTVVDESMPNCGANTTELEPMHDNFDLYCDLYNGSKQVAADVMWVVKD